MVFFICNHCGESLKKQVVDKHVWKCKREINVSCMDCLKDFLGTAYEAHTSCISEAEKYSGKDYVPKASANKGAKKQEGWVATIRSITSAKKNLPSGVMAVFDVINRNDNISRKKNGFVNFFQNSARHIRKPDVEAAWALIEEETKQMKSAPQSASNGEQKSQTPSSHPNGAAAKRKAEDEENHHEEHPKAKNRKVEKASTNGHHSDDREGLLQPGTNGTNGTQEKQNGDETASETQKFRWNETIRDLLLSKNNQMKLSKMKKKLLKRYRQFAGSDELQLDGKFEKKLNKKLKKANVVVENDTVRLVE